MNSPRDAIYKQLFSHPEIVRDLVTGFLSADWAQALEVTAFERVNASYASEQGKARHEDVVWRARIDGEWVYVYILLEFQSRPDKWMALRMQVYIGLLYQDLVAQHKLSKHGKLPPVLPIVFYHGHRPWRAATELSQLMLMKRMRRPDLAPARTSLATWLRFTLHCDLEAANLNIEEDLAMPPKRKLRFEEVFNDEFFEQIVREPQENWKKGIQEGMQQGIQQGMQQGMQQGELLALRGVLDELLVGDVPAEATPKIARADSSQLRAWIKSLIGGVSPQQLFTEG